MYKVKIINQNAQIVRVSEDVEEVIEHKFLPVRKAEIVVAQLNLGHVLDWDNLIN
jgi:hypothetical protein